MKKINYDKIWDNDLPEWDKEKLWNQIENNLKDKKEKHSFLWLFFIFFFIIIIYGIVWLPHTRNNFSKTQNLSKSINASTKHEVVNDPEDYSKNHFHSLKNNDYLSIKNKEQKTTELFTFKKENMIYGNFNFNQDSENKIDTIDPIIFDKTFNNLSYLPQLNTLVLFAKSQRELVFENNNTFDIPNERISNQKNSFLSIISGIGFASVMSEFDKNLKWQNRKFNSENQLYNYAFSFQYNRPVFKNLYISAGINFQNLMVNFSDKDSVIFIKNFQSDSAYIAFLTEPSYFSGTKTITNIKYRKFNIFNYISHFSIPVNIGIRKSYNKNGFILNAGILYRLNTSLKGYTISNSNQIVLLTDLKSDIKKYTGISDFTISGYYWQSLYKDFNFSIGFETVIPIKPEYSFNSIDFIEYLDKSLKYRLQMGLTYMF